MSPLTRRLTLLVCLSCSWLAASREALGNTARIGRAEALERLRGFDAYMDQLLRDWSGVGFGVGIVLGDESILSKGYGHGDERRTIPFTAKTPFPIASNTKLFTAVSAGFLVEEGVLTWDEPVREAVPTIRFHDDGLDRTVTLRDMLAHRTGVTRHDLIWYRNSLSGEALFERLKYLEPSAPLRQTFLYNNLMYAAVGHIVSLKAGKPWEDYVREKILQPLGMSSTRFEDKEGIAPAGAIISDLDDLSHWLIALMNEGRYDGRQALPPATLRATLEPAIARSNRDNEVRGWRELLNPVAGMGRRMVAYRGHALTYHGGDTAGFHSQISYMPDEHFGVIVLVIGDHTAELYDAISYQVYERLLGLDLTPWSERLLERRLKAKAATSVAKARAAEGRVRNTRPSHQLVDYAGEYEHPAYGALKIELVGRRLQFAFRDVRAPLDHFHYDRFDTPYDEENGRYSVSFSSTPLGDVDQITMSLDEADVIFVRRAERPQLRQVERLVGRYLDPAGYETQVSRQPDGSLALRSVGGLTTPLLPYRELQFRVRNFANVLYQFIEEDGHITALKRSDPDGVSLSRRE